MMMSSFTAVLAVFAAAVSSVCAHPMRPVSNIVFSPTITSPVAGAVWTPGTNATVTWLTSNIPAAAMNYNGTLDLGHPDANSEHLEADAPLASGFKYSDGTVTFAVPSEIFSRTNYAVYLFGDSGNASPLFTIKSVIGL